MVTQTHQLRRGGRVLLLDLGRDEEGRGGRQLQDGRVDGLREEESVEQGHRQAERLQVEAELAVDGADPLEDAVPHLRVEEGLRGQAVEHVVPRLQRLAAGDGSENNAKLRLKFTKFHLSIRPHLVPHVDVHGILEVAAAAVVVLVICHFFFFCELSFAHQLFKIKIVHSPTISILLFV